MNVRTKNIVSMHLEHYVVFCIVSMHLEHFVVFCIVSMNLEHYVVFCMYCKVMAIIVKVFIV